MEEYNYRNPIYRLKLNKLFFMYKEYKIHIFFEKLLMLSIFLFIFSIPFNPQISKTIINQMFYFWIFSLQFQYFVIFFKNKLLLILSIFILLIYLSYLWSEPPLFNVNYISMSVKFWFFPTVILTTSMKQKYLKYYISTFLLAMFINELISYAIYFEYIKESILGFTITGNAYDPVPFQTSHMEYSVYISFTIFILLYSLFYRKFDLKSIVYTLFLITMISNLFLSAGRSGQFTFIIVSFVLIAIYFHNKIKLIAGSFFILIFILTLAYNTSDTFKARIYNAENDIKKALFTKNYNTSFGIRISSYILIPEIIKITPPLFGVGFNDTNKVIHNLHMQKFKEFSEFSHQQGHLHNTYITIYAALGIIGITILFYIFYLILTLKLNSHFINYLKYVFIFTIFFAGFTENLFREKEIMLLFSTFLSIIVVQNQFEQKQKEVSL